MIKELCEQRNIRHTYTSKLFYKRFSSSITVSVNPKLYERASAEADAVRNKYRARGYTVLPTKGCDECWDIWQKFRRAKESLARKIISQCDIGELDYEFTVLKSSLTIYTNDPAVLIRVANARPRSIVKVCSPRSEKEVEFLRQNTDKLVRDAYFHGQYPYRVLFKWQVEDSYVDDLIVNTFGTENEDEINGDRALYNYGRQRAVYIKEFTDVFMVKIALGDFIEKIEEVVLSKDI